jgi:hypothetical protein
MLPRLHVVTVCDHSEVGHTALGVSTLHAVNKTSYAQLLRTNTFTTTVHTLDTAVRLSCNCQARTLLNILSRCMKLHDF